MLAAFFRAPGPAGVVEVGQWPTPTPGPGQVRVKVAAAALNPIDVYARAGMVALPPTTGTGYITGSDLAGTVDAVGPGATRFHVGDRVWGSNQGMLGRAGTFAEYCCPGEDYLYPLPAGVPEVTAAAAALTGITAHLGLFRRANLAAGETVFVNGGTGGVGSMVVQMAKATGARVITTAGSDEKAAAARKLGADVVFLYKSDDVTAGVLAATNGRGAEVYFETQPPSDLDAIITRTAPDGRVVLMAGRSARPPLPNGPFYVKGLSLLGFAMFNAPPDEQRRCADDLNRWLAAKTVWPIVGQVFPLSQARQAHELQEANTLGKAGTLSGKIVVVPEG